MLPFQIMPDTAKKASDTTKTDSTADEDVKHRKFQIGLEFANDQSNHGLKNSSPLPYMEPSFTYTSKSGFYIEVEDQFLFVGKSVSKSRGGFDVFTANPGWDFDLSDNTSLDLNITYNYYKKKTPDLLKSGLFLVPEVYLDQYIIGELEGRVTIDYDMYKVTNPKQPKTPNDFVITPDLQYSFEWDFGKHKKNSFSFIPEVSVDFGTKNFITVYQDNVISDTATNSKTNYNTSSSNSFGALDCNVIVTLELKLGKFKIEPILNYVIPLYNENNIVSSKPYGYGSLSLTYTLKSKK